MEQLDARGRSTTLVHFVFQVEPERVACMPNMTEFHCTAHHPQYQRSNSVAAVTCPACKRSAEYGAAGGK